MHIFSIETVAFFIFSIVALASLLEAENDFLAAKDANVHVIFVRSTNCFTFSSELKIERFILSMCLKISPK